MCILNRNAPRASEMYLEMRSGIYICDCEAIVIVH